MDFAPSVYEHCARLIGRTPCQVSRTPGLLFAGQAAAFNLYGHAPVVVGVDIYNIEAEALGATVTNPGGNGIPAITTPLLARTADLRDLPPLDPRRGRIPMLLAVGRRLRDALPGADVRIPLAGPFSVAAGLVGTEELLCAAASDPDAAGDALASLVEGQTRLCRAAHAAGLDIAFFESAAAPPLLSPALFRRVELPALRELLRQAAGILRHPVPCVIGGDTLPVLDAILETGTRYVICPAETDQPAFMAAMTTRPEVTVRINLAPAIVAGGTPGTLRREADRVLALARQREHVSIGTGALPYETPPENVLWLKEYVRAAGRPQEACPPPPPPPRRPLPANPPRRRGRPPDHAGQASNPPPACTGGRDRVNNEETVPPPAGSPPASRGPARDFPPTRRARAATGRKRVMTRLPVADCHNHLCQAADLDVILAAAARVPLQRLTFLALPASRGANNLPLVLWAKKRHPDKVFAFGAWNHLDAPQGRHPAPAALAGQVRELAATGVDGWKILESKPDMRRETGEALDGPCYAEAFAALAELDLPVLWHVADPEEFWDPARTPAWALARNWGYGPDFPAPQAILAEAERVLDRHPRLRVVFAHFLFMSADLDRAARFLAAHPRAGIDLAPGIECFYNLSRDRDRAREFFIRHADRIFFGTDAGLIRGAPLAAVEARFRLVLRFLATADTFRIPPEADFLLGPPEDGVIRGLDLPPAALTAILAANQRRWAGEHPRPLDLPAAAATSRRIAAELRQQGADEQTVRETERIADDMLATP